MSMHTESAVCTPTSRCPESTNRLARDPPSAALRRRHHRRDLCGWRCRGKEADHGGGPAAAKTTTGSADVARAKSSRARSSAMNSRINRSPAEASDTPSTARLWADSRAEVAQELSPGASQPRSNRDSVVRLRYDTRIRPAAFVTAIVASRIAAHWRMVVSSPTALRSPPPSSRGRRSRTADPGASTLRTRALACDSLFPKGSRPVALNTLASDDSPWSLLVPSPPGDRST